MQNTLLTNKHAENIVVMMMWHVCIVARCCTFSSHALMLLFSDPFSSPLYFSHEHEEFDAMATRAADCYQGTLYSAATCCSKSDTTNITHKGNVCCQSIKLKTIMATKSLLFTFKYYVSKWYLTCVYFWMCGHFQAAVLCLFVCYFVCFLSQKLAPFRFFLCSKM